MELLEQLNPMQQKAVLHKDGPLLLLAGAGSGKTRVLTHRIAYLIENGVRPWNILAITFTNKAAKEMRERINSLLEYGSEDVWVSTFHSMCVRILKRDIEKIGYEKNFSIYDADDQEKLIKECIAQLKFSEKLFIPKGIMSEISSLKNELITYKQYEKDSESDFRQSKVSQIYSLYQKKLMNNNALDFDDLIFKTIDLFIAEPRILEFYQEKFKYIMVDEYQDTNTAQYQLIHHLAKKYNNLCVVGDDDQSIYGWRGANVRNILDFEKDFKDTVTIKLEQNYRSTQNILNTANSVILNNENRKQKSLWTENKKGIKIHIIKTEDPFYESLFIANEIKSIISTQGKNYNDFALLYRTNAQSRVLEEQLVKSNIPYRLLGGTRFYDRKEIKDIISYLKVLNNPSDDLAIKRIINVPKRGIGATSINKIEEYAQENNISFFKALIHSDKNQDLLRVSKKLNEFIEFISMLRFEAENGSISDLISIIVDQTGYINQLQLENTPESLGRIENLKELISKVIEYEKKSDESSLSGFLDEIALVADIDNYEANSNTVVLMTMHSSKGLEFPYVFIAGMEEGIFPSYRSMISSNPNDIEEERRLCYVGITRAKEQLYLIYAKSRMINGNTQYNSPSRFLKEIPDELIEQDINSTKNKIINNQKVVESKKNIVSKDKITYRPQFEKVKPYQSIMTKSIISPKNIELDFVQGDKVKHSKFGEGVIQEICPAGADYEILVKFEKFGEKRMMSTFSKLTKI